MRGKAEARGLTTVQAWMLGALAVLLEVYGAVLFVDGVSEVLAEKVVHLVREVAGR